MKKMGLLVLLAFALLIPASSVNAQSKKKDTSRSYRDDNFGERLGAEIEKFVKRVTGELSFDEMDEDTLPAKSRRRYRTADIESESNTVTYSSNKVIEESEIVNGNVVVKGGDLTVYGKVDGDVLVIGGILYVKDGGKITGNARVINGNIVKDDGGVIEGYEDKTSSATASYRTERRKFTRSGNSFNAPWLSETSNLDNFIFRYNRVEGLFLGFGSEKKYYWEGEKNFSAFGSFGYGFKSHLWRGNLGLARQFSLSGEDTHRLLEFGAEGYSLTDSKDRWLIGVHENSAAAFLIHEDFRDYFTREGYTLHTAVYAQQSYLSTEFKIAYLVDKYDSLTKNADWSIFGGEKVFRPNPPITPGSMRSVLASVGLSTLSKTAYGPEGWTIHASAEFGPRTLGGDFNFDQYIVDIRRYQPIGRYDNFNIRLRVGTSDATLPPQKMFDLGGLGTLNAFPFKSESGNRMILANAEYILNGNFLDDLDFWPTWLFRGVNFLILSDAGLTRDVAPSLSPTEGFDTITWREFRHDLGFGFANRSGSFRIAVTWRTDVKEPARLLFRFERPF